MPPPDPASGVTSGPEPGPKVDGRTARAERTRAAIVEAHLAVILDGDLRPTAEKIAQRAGVSLRALWSHFTDMETLFGATGARVLELQDEAHEPIPPTLPLPARIDAYCRQRARLLERLAPAARAAQLKEPFSPALQRHRLAHLDRARTEVAELFAPELAAAAERGSELLAALVAVSMWPTWATWRDAMGVDVDTASRALAHTIAALLAPNR